MFTSQTSIFTFANTPTPSLPAPEFPTQLLFIYLALFILGMFGSALFSGLETASYTLSRLRLFIRASANDPRAQIIRHETENMPRLISSLLIGNNIANYLLSFAVTAILSQILMLSEFTSIALQALILTPFLFLFVETLPKEFFRSRADRIIYPLAPLLRIIRIIFTALGLLPLIQLTNRFILRLAKNPDDNQQFLSARARMATQLHEGVGQGIISTHQIDIVERSLNARNLTVNQIMTPWQLTKKLSTQTTHHDIQNQQNELPHSRYPVIQDSTGNIQGIVTLLDALLETADENNATTTIEKAIHPVTYLNETDTVPNALNTLRQSGAWLAIIGTPQKPQGIVTRKDLLDPLLGSIAAA